MKANRMKAKLRAGKPAFGVSVMIPSPQIVEMLGALVSVANAWLRLGLALGAK